MVTRVAVCCTLLQASRTAVQGGVSVPVPSSPIPSGALLCVSPDGAHGLPSAGVLCAPCLPCAAPVKRWQAPPSKGQRLSVRLLVCQPACLFACLSVFADGKLGLTFGIAPASASACEIALVWVIVSHSVHVDLSRGSLSLYNRSGACYDGDAEVCLRRYHAMASFGQQNLATLITA